jgi:hypothetical protein
VVNIYYCILLKLEGVHRNGNASLNLLNQLGFEVLYQETMKSHYTLSSLY